MRMEWIQRNTKSKIVRRCLALTLIFIMLSSFAQTGIPTVKAENADPTDWEERLDQVDAIYTNQPSTHFNVYQDDAFNDARVQELMLTEPYQDFLKTQQHEIVDRFGRPYLIKAIAFENNIWLSEPYGNHSPYVTEGDVNAGKQCHTKDSYPQIKEMGYNSVRFLMHLNWFNDLYKTDTNGNILTTDGKKVINWENPGLNWIRKNVTWAEENDIKLILNMHSYQREIWQRPKDTVLPAASGDLSGQRTLLSNISTSLRSAFGGGYFPGTNDQQLFDKLCEKYNEKLANRAAYDLGDIGLEPMEQNEDHSFTYNDGQILELEYRVNQLTCAKYQRQLINAWTVIGEMLRSQDTVIGYGLLNEPVPSILFSTDQNGTSIADDDATSGQWEELAESVAQSTRNADPNHIFFVERLQGVKNDTRGAELLENEYSIYSRIADDIVIKDDNYAYEIHTYVPYQLSHIPCSDYKINDEELGNYYGNIKISFDSGIQELKYPNDDIVSYYQINGLEQKSVPVKNGNNIVSKESLPVKLENQEGNWQRYNEDHSIKYQVPDKGEVSDEELPNVATILFTVEDLGGSQAGRGHVLFDNLVVKDSYTDANGEPQEKVVLSSAFSMPKEYGWSNNYNVGIEYKKEGGYSLKGRTDVISCFPEGYPNLLDKYRQNGCLEIANRTGKNYVQINLQALNPKPGHQYSVSADMKYVLENGVSTKAKACVEIDFSKSPDAHMSDRDYIKHTIEDLMKIGTKTQQDEQGNTIEVKRPVFLGECGMSMSALAKYDTSDVGEGKTYETYKDKLLANGINPNAQWEYCPVSVEGGVQVMADYFDIINELSKTEFPLGFDVHEYHSRGFGVYTNAPTEQPGYKTDMNRDYVRLFMEKLPTMGIMNDSDVFIAEVGDNKTWFNEKAGRYNTAAALAAPDGTEMMAVRSVCESLGFTVEWNDSDFSVIITNPSTGQFYKAAVNSSEIVTNSGTVTIAKPVILLDRTVYVPGEAFFSLLGYRVETAADAQKKYVVIHNKNTSLSQEEFQNLIACKQTVSILYDNATMIPLRYVAESMGMRVDWDSVTSKTTVEYIADGINKKLSLAVNNTEAILVDNIANTTEKINFLTAPVNNNGKTYIPGNEFFSAMGVRPVYCVDLNQTAYLDFGGKRILLEYQ